MTEARHDQAVALLTGTSPTISLLVEREQASGSPGRTRSHSPPPPEPSDSPDQEEAGDDRLGNHLMEDEYPIEVRAFRSIQKDNVVQEVCVPW